MAEADPPVFVKFDQSATSLTVSCGRSDLRMYSLQAVEQRLISTYRLPFGEAVLFEPLSGTALVAAVTVSDPKRLLIADCVRYREVDDHLYPNAILALKVNSSHIIVCLENQIYIHNIGSMALEHIIDGLPTNTKGVCALTVKDKPNCFLAYPSSSSTGEVTIFDAHRLQAVTTIEAHRSPIMALAFSHTGQEIATVSKRGAVIRVFSTETAETVHEFRYTWMRAVAIDSLTFSTCGTYLAATANSGFIHIFQCVATPTSRSSVRNFGLFRRWRPKRAFTAVRLGRTFVKCNCAIAKAADDPEGEKMLLLVATADAFLKVFTLPSNEGGDCTLLKTFDLNYRDDACVNYSGLLTEKANSTKKKIAAAKEQSCAVEI